MSRGLADTQQLQFTLTLLANDGIKQPATLVSALVAVAYLAVTSEGVLLALVCLAAVPLTVLVKMNVSPALMLMTPVPTFVKPNPP